MSITTQNSTEYANVAVTSPPVRNRPDQQHGRVRIATFTFTQSGAGDIASLFNLCTIKAGRGRIIKNLCGISTSAWGASATLNIGHTGWTKTDGTSQAASVDVLLDDKDVSSAVINAPLGVGTNADDSGFLVFDSRTDIVIQGKVAGAVVPDAAIAEGWIAYVID